MNLDRRKFRGGGVARQRNFVRYMVHVAFRGGGVARCGSVDG
jgi:hypothetical protein